MKILGGFLMFIGGIIDVIQMFMLTGDPDFEIFNGLTIAGTIIFFVGLGLYSLSNYSSKV